MRKYLRDLLDLIGRKQTVLRLLLIALCYALYFAQPFALRGLLDGAHPERRILFIALLAISLTMPPAIDCINNWLLQQTRRASKSALLTKVQQKPYSYRLVRSTAEMRSYITEISLACRKLEDSLVHHVVRLLVMVGIYAASLLLAAPLLSAAYILFVFVYLSVSVCLSRGHDAAVTKALGATAKAGAAIADNLDNYDVARTSRALDHEQRIFDAAFIREASIYEEVQAKNNRTACLQQLCVIAFLVLTLTMALGMGNEAFADALLILVYSIINLTGFGSQFLSIKEMVDRLKAGLLALGYDDREVYVDTRSYAPHSDAVSLENVVFAYGENAVVDGGSLRFKKGAISALVGPNGSGKSTILKLCAGLLNQTEGKIVLPCSREDSIVYISQSGQLFNRSVWDNVCYPNSHDEAEVMALIREIGLGRLFPTAEALKEEGTGDLVNGLSGGERQKVLAVRALLAKPAILLSDEITSGMDVESAKLFYGLLRKHLPDATVVCITHRAEELGYCDEVVSM